MLGVSGGRKVRSMAFDKLLHQEIGYYDRYKHAAGQVTTHLSKNAMPVQELTGHTMGTVRHEICVILSSFLIANMSCWEVGIITSLEP